MGTFNLSWKISNPLNDLCKEFFNIFYLYKFSAVFWIYIVDLSASLFCFILQIFVWPVTGDWPVKSVLSWPNALFSMLFVSLHIKLIFDDFQEYFKLNFCNTFVCEYIVYIMTFSCVCILELVCPKHFFILSWQMKPWSLKTNSMLTNLRDT